MKALEHLAIIWIGPVFLVSLGTKIVFDWDLLVSVMPMVAILTLGIMVTAFWLNVAVPVTIAWWKPSFKGTKTLFGNRRADASP